MYHRFFKSPLGVSVQGTPFKMFDPLGALVGFVGNIFGAEHQSGLTQEQQRLQSNLNKSEMAYSQQLNKEYQEYLNNTQYGAQMRGLRNSGINPAGVSASVGAMQASNGIHTGSSGPSASQSNMGSTLLQGLSMQSQIKNTEANTSLLDAEADKAFAEAEKLRAETPGAHATSGMLQQAYERNAENLQLDIDIKEGQKQLLDSENKKMLADVDEVRSRISNIDEDTKRKIISNAFAEERERLDNSSLKAQIFNYYASGQAGQLSAAAAMKQANSAWQSVLQQEQKIATDLMVANSQVAINKVVMQQQKLEYDLTKKYGDAKAITGMVGDCIGTAVGAFVGSTVGLRGAGVLGKATKIKGFGH